MIASTSNCTPRGKAGTCTVERAGLGALVKWRCRNAAAGLVVTSHASTELPTLYRTCVDAALAQSLVSTLTAERDSPITAADVAASHACHGSNLRELWFALYDRHELLQRRQTADPQPA